MEDQNRCFMAVTSSCPLPRRGANASCWPVATPGQGWPISQATWRVHFPHHSKIRRPRRTEAEDAAMLNGAESGDRTRLGGLEGP